MPPPSQSAITVMGQGAHPSEIETPALADPPRSAKGLSGGGFRLLFIATTTFQVQNDKESREARLICECKWVLGFEKTGGGDRGYPLIPAPKEARRGTTKDESIKYISFQLF